jgi:prophage regulatory protein
MTTTIQTQTRIIRRREVEARVGLSRSTIYSKLRGNRPGEIDPSFPKPIKIGPKAVGWIESEVEAWLAEQAAKRQG